MPRLCLLTGLAALGLASTLEAQATSDEARLVFTVGAGYVGGGDLWSISGQPIRVAGSFTDTLGLSRTLRSGLGVVFSGTYFPGSHVGFGGEVLLLGLGTEDGCTVEFTSGDPDTQEICTSIAAMERRATSVALSGSLTYRFLSKEAISPYARVNLGAVITQQSLIKVNAAYHAMHHITPDNFYSSYLNLFDLLFARSCTIRPTTHRRVTSGTTGRRLPDWSSWPAA